MVAAAVNGHPNEEDGKVDEFLESVNGRLGRGMIVWKFPFDCIGFIKLFFV